MFVIWCQAWSMVQTVCNYKAACRPTKFRNFHLDKYWNLEQYCALNMNAVKRPEDVYPKLKNKSLKSAYSSRAKYPPFKTIVSIDKIGSLGTVKRFHISVHYYDDTMMFVSTYACYLGRRK